MIPHLPRHYLLATLVVLAIISITTLRLKVTSLDFIASNLNSSFQIDIGDDGQSI